MLRIEDWDALLGVEDMKLPDGLVEGTTLVDWQRLLDCLAQTSWIVTFNNGGVSVPAFTVTEMFDGDTAAKTISIEFVCAAVVNVFVYQPNSVDFDFNLDEIECQQDLDELLDFVRLVGQQTKRDVSLRYEGSHHSFGGYRHESDHFFLIGSEQQSRVDSSIQTGDSQVDERRNWERSRLVVAAARLREFRNLEIGLKQLVDDLLPVIEEQTVLPHFWSEMAMNAWGQLEVDYALALDAATSIPAFTYQPVRENVIELEDLIEEGKRRLSLLESPLNRFACDQPLMTWRQATELLPIGSTLEGTVTQITPFGFFVDLNLPFAGLVHKPGKPVFAGLHNGLSITLTVIGFGRHTFQLSVQAERNSRQTTTPKA